MNTIDQEWCFNLKDVLHFGKRIAPRGRETVELIECHDSGATSRDTSESNINRYKGRKNIFNRGQLVE